MDSESKKEKILDAAMHCFARFGINKATMDDIAQAIGMKKASLYYYYKNKEAIFSDAISRESKSVIREIDSQIKEIPSAQEKLRQFVVLGNEYFKKRAKMLELSVQVMIESKLMINEAHNKMEKRVGEYLKLIIRFGVENKEFAPCDETKVSEMIRMMLNALRFEIFQNARQQLVSEIHFDEMNERGLFMIDILCNGLKVR